MFKPSVIFIVLWGIQCLLHVFFYDVFYDFSSTTWFILSIATLGFLLGCFIIGSLKLPSLNFISYKSIEKSNYTLFCKSLVFLYLIGSAIVCYSIFNYLNEMTGGNVSPITVRQILINDFVGERVLFSKVRYFFAGVMICVFVLCFASSLSKRFTTVVYLIGLISGILTTGRLSILLFLVASSLILYNIKLIKKRHVFFFLMLFVLLFFGLAFILGKGTDNKTFFEALLWNFQVYTMSSFACFNDFVVSGAQHVEGGLLIPNSFRNVASYIFGEYYFQKPDLNPFSYVPLACNTYTILFPLYHDGDFFAVFVLMFLLGSFHTYLYKTQLFYPTPINLYLYSISMYPLVMTIFEDAYFSSPGFWLISILPMILFLLYCIIIFPNRKRLQ